MKFKLHYAEKNTHSVSFFFFFGFLNLNKRTGSTVNRVNSSAKYFFFFFSSSSSLDAPQP